MTDLELFVESVEEVVGLLRKGDWYSLVRAAGIIRQWFFDSVSLVDRVNKQFKHKFVFRVTTLPMFPGAAKPVFAWRNPLPPPNYKTQELKRDDFFRFTCTFAVDTEITVQQVLMYCANVAGGVHRGTPKTEEEKLLAELDQIIRIGGVQAAGAIGGILTVILVALDPLLRSAMHAVYGAKAKALFDQTARGRPNAQQLLDEVIRLCERALAAQPDDQDLKALLEKARGARDVTG